MTPPNKTGSHRRWLLWLPLLAFSGYLVVTDSKESTSEPGAVVQPVARKPLPARNGQSSDSGKTTPFTSLELRLREDLYPKQATQRTGKDLFSATDWSPPPPIASPAPPGPPMAPSVPFTFLGKRKAETDWEVFLSKGNSTFIVRAGQTFDDSYRVESIQPPQMTLTYMPLNQTQTIAVGEAR